MIKPLTVFDIARFSIFRDSDRSNRAYTVRNLLSSNPDGLSMVGAWRQRAAPADNGFAFVLSHRNQLLGLISARERSGKKSWEISHLYVRDGDEALLSDLLESASKQAGAGGAERVFLRLRRGDDLVDEARRSGFFPRIPEVLYKSAPHAPISSSGVELPMDSVTLRKAKPVDEHGLFRLYNAATPSEIRYSVGMTMEQWAASRENGVRHCKEFVLEDIERLGASLKVMWQSSTGQMLIMMRPEYEACLPAIVDYGLGRLSKTKTVYCLVPEYQVTLQSVLRDRGFGPISDYITLVKSLAIESKKDVRVRAAAASAGLTHYSKHNVQD